MTAAGLFPRLLFVLKDRQQLYIWPLTRPLSRTAAYVYEVRIALLHKLRCMALGTVEHVTCEHP